MKPNLIKVRTYAKTIGKSRQWVYRLIKANELKAEKIDGVLFINQKLN